MTLSPVEQQQLRAVVFSLPDAAFERYTPESREAAQTIVSWFYCLPLARGDMERTRDLARRALAVELERRHAQEIDGLVVLLRETDPATIGRTAAA